PSPCRAPSSPPCPYTPLFRSRSAARPPVGGPPARSTRPVAPAPPDIPRGLGAPRDPLHYLYLAGATVARRLQPPSPTRVAICVRSEEHTSELQSRENLVCRLL